jgi:hypothetical protein
MFWYKIANRYCACGSGCFISDPDYFFFLGSNSNTKEVGKKEISCPKSTGYQNSDPIRNTDLAYKIYPEKLGITGSICKHACQGRHQGC